MIDIVKSPDVDQEAYENTDEWTAEICYGGTKEETPAENSRVRIKFENIKPNTRATKTNKQLQDESTVLNILRTIEEEDSDACNEALRAESFVTSGPSSLTSSARNSKFGILKKASEPATFNRISTRKANSHVKFVTDLNTASKQAKGEPMHLL